MNDKRIAWAPEQPEEPSYRFYEDESLFRNLFEAADDPIYIIENFKCIKCNEAALRMLECDEFSDISEKCPWEFSPPVQPDGRDSKQKAIELMTAASYGQPQRFHWKHIGKKGKECDVEVSLCRLVRGPLNLLVSIVRDISALKQIENELRESLEKYRILFDLESDALALIEIETGNMLEVNKSFLDLYGYSKDEVLRMKNTDFSAEPRETTQATREQRTFVPVRYHKKKDGTVFPTEIKASNLSYHGKNVHIAAIRDITERIRLEHQLQRSTKMNSMGLMAGGVAHDLNNILAGLVTLPDLILMDLPKESKYWHLIQMMQKAGYRAAAMVKDLMTIAKGVAIDRKPIDLLEQINDYLESPEFLKLKENNPDIKFKTDRSSEGLCVMGSEVHIRKIIMNLVSNAAEAIDGTGTIEIKTENRFLDESYIGYEEIKPGDYVLLSVTDSGSGISEDDLEHIFEPFFTKKKMGRKGTGLGLAVVWNAVRDHSGFIDIQSGQSGTGIDIYFPRAKGQSYCQIKNAAIEDFKGNGESILVVDDVEIQRQVTCQLLANIGYNPVAVCSGEKAVAYVAKHPVDLILLDMIMAPGMNGLETYRRIKKIHPGQKAIIVSGLAETEDVKEARKLGAVRFLLKPFKVEEIATAIRAELNLNG